MTNGTDISAFQPASPNIGSNTFGFVKATEGVGWTSPVWQAQAQALRNARDGVGYYHFCNGLNPPQAEAQFFWNTIKGFWQPGEPIALDVEGAFFTNVADPVGWVLACAQELKALSGLIPVFYSDWAHVKGPYNWQPLVDFNMGLWGAAYNSVGFGDPSPWPAIFVWQDSDHDESSGGDDDVLYGDLNTWRAYGTPAGAPAINPQSTTVTPEEDIMATIDDLKAALKSPDVLDAIAKTVHTRPLPYYDPNTGQDTGKPTTVAALVGFADFRYVQTANAIAALAELVKSSLPNADAAAQAAYDKFLADLKALNLHIGA